MKTKSTSFSPQKGAHFNSGGKVGQGSQVKKEGLFVDSWSAFSEYVKYAPKLIKAIHCPARERPKVEKILQSAETPYEVSIAEGEKFCVQVSLDWASEEDILRAVDCQAELLVVVCDHVTDTRNLGAIARTAAYFGAKFLIFSKDRQAPVTSAALSTAQGAFALLRPMEVTNIPRTLRMLKQAGIWIAAADMNGQNVETLTHSYEKLALVLGSEDKGVSRAAMEASDFTVSVVPAAPLLESLNVSVASGILLHSLTKHRAKNLKS